jgi:hypothetical protein
MRSPCIPISGQFFDETVKAVLLLVFAAVSGGFRPCFLRKQISPSIPNSEEDIPAK